MRPDLPSHAELVARDGLLQRARELRTAAALDDALAVLDQLADRHPAFSRQFQERGHCQVLRRDATAAVAALEQAVRLNPALPACWDMLVQLYRLGGETDAANRAADNLALLQDLPVAVVAASSLFSDGDLVPAERVIRDYLEGDPDNLGALRLLARIRLDQGAAAEAEALLARVVAAAPDYHAARLDFAMALLQQQKHVEARREAEVLLAQDPANREYLKQYGAACIGLGDHAPVIDLFGRLLGDGKASDADVADLRLWRANALKVEGRRDEAIADYRAALAARPDYGVAWFSLANLKTYRFSDNEISRMCAAQAQPGLDPRDRVYLCFALGKALEDRGRYEASWQAYARGNALHQLDSRYAPEATERLAAQLRAIFTPAFFAARQGWGAPADDPVFIVGLPRSGSTLVEQILASHPQVEGTQELPEIGRYVGELCGTDPLSGLPAHPEALAHLTEAGARALGERYLAETRAYRRSGRPLFVDKMPANAWHIGLIQLILPRARIIDVRREPMACGFSNFKQLYGAGTNLFSSDLSHIGRHYRAYLGLMRHWDAVLPGRILRLCYEDLVADVAGSVGTLLERCGLPFDAACLRFHETRRPIRTPSAEQVRRPIGRDGLLRWRQYAPWLDPLRTALGDAVDTWRD